MDTLPQDTFPLVGFNYLIIAKTFVPNKIRSQASDTPGSPTSNYLMLNNNSSVPKVSHSMFLSNSAFFFLFHFL